MLSRAEYVSIYFIPHIFSAKGHIQLRLGRKVVNYKKFRMTKQEFIELTSQQNINPQKFIAYNKTYWLFEGKFYRDSESLKYDEVKALLITRDRLNQQKITRAKTIAATEEQIASYKRVGIPEDIRLMVWERDKGRCTRCGSTTELQYDHIIPLTKGGASTAENLQILCGRCNRLKGASVA